MSVPRQRTSGYVSETEMSALRAHALDEATRVRAGRYVARVAVLNAHPPEWIAEVLEVLGLAPDMGERPDEMANRRA